MRSTFSYLRMLLLLWSVGLYSVNFVAASADTLSPPPRHIQIQCSAIRVRAQDVDDLGINFDVMPSGGASLAPGSSLTLTSPPRFTDLTNGSEASKMLDRLTKLHYLVFTAPLATAIDGRNRAVSLSQLKDPGIDKASRIIVTPHIQSDGTISLSIAPQFEFIDVPGPENKAASVSVEGFPIRRTLPNGSLLVFSEALSPVPGQRFGQILPAIPAVSNKFHEDMQSTQLWIFLTATLLPDVAPHPIPTESPQQLFSPQALSIVKGATRVETLRITQTPQQPARSLTSQDPQIPGSYIIAHGRQLAQSQALQLTNALLNQRNYPTDGNACIPEPGFAFRFWRGKEAVLLTVCFQCHILNAFTLDERGHILAFGGSGFFTGLLVPDAKQGFPNDPTLQSLGVELSNAPRPTIPAALP